MKRARAPRPLPFGVDAGNWMRAGIWMHGRQSIRPALYSDDINVRRQPHTELAYLKATQIKGHSTYKYRHLKQGVQQYTASSIEGKVSHSRHRNKCTKSESYSLRYR